MCYNITFALCFFRAKKVIPLRYEEWCHLNAIQSSGVTLLQEVTAPLLISPNVKIHVEEETHTICIQGIAEAVTGAYNHIIGHLNKDLHIPDR